MSEVSQIRPSDTGRFRITTQGSEHIWDLDTKTWVRNQMDGLNPMQLDGEVRSLRIVITWPEVGGVFEVFDVRRWHRSSTIRKIEKLEES